MEWDSNNNIEDYIKMNALNTRVSMLYIYSDTVINDEGHEELLLRKNPLLEIANVDELLTYDKIKTKLIGNKEIITSNSIEL